MYSADTPQGARPAPSDLAIISDINVPNLGDQCRIRNVRLSFYFTDPALSILTAEVSHTAYTFGARPLFDIVTLTGGRVGTVCADVIFDQTASLSFPGEPPYTGVYRPLGLLASPAFNGFIGTNPAGTWTIRFFEVSPTAVLQCWRLQLDLQ